MAVRHGAWPPIKRGKPPKGTVYARAISLPIPDDRQIPIKVSVGPNQLSHERFRDVEAEIIGWAWRPEIGAHRGFAITAEPGNNDPDRVTETLAAPMVLPGYVGARVIDTSPADFSGVLGLGAPSAEMAEPSDATINSEISVSDYSGSSATDRTYVLAGRLDERQLALLKIASQAGLPDSARYGIVPSAGGSMSGVAVIKTWQTVPTLKPATVPGLDMVGLYEHMRLAGAHYWLNAAELDMTRNGAISAKVAKQRPTDQVVVSPRNPISRFVGDSDRKQVANVVAYLYYCLAAAEYRYCST